MIGLDTGFFVELVRGNKQALDVFDQIRGGKKKPVYRVLRSMN
jgi:hypothetical protein